MGLGIGRSLRCLLALAVSACGGSHRGPAQGASGAGSDPPRALQTLQLPEAGRFYHGVLPAGIGDPAVDISAASLDDYENAVGRKVTYVYFSHEWAVSRLFPGTTARWIRERGAVPFVRLMMRSQRNPLVADPVFTLDRIIAGEFDADLSAWADAARAFATPLLVEYGTEVNGDWNPWSAPYNGGLNVGPEKFKRAYRHVVETMRARGAANLTWALHYNGQSYPEDPRNVPVSYYPGDDVVDLVGISVYGSERSNDQRCPTFRSLVDDMVPQLRAAAAQRPVFILEFGITNTNAGCPAAPWVKAAFDDLLGGRWPEVRGFAWWYQRWNNDGARGTDMLVQDDPGVQAAFRSAVAAPAVLDAPMVLAAPAVN